MRLLRRLHHYAHALTAKHAFSPDTLALAHFNRTCCRLLLQSLPAIRKPPRLELIERNQTRLVLVHVSHRLVDALLTQRLAHGLAQLAYLVAIEAPTPIRINLIEHSTRVLLRIVIQHPVFEDEEALLEAFARGRTELVHECLVALTGLRLHRCDIFVLLL